MSSPSPSAVKTWLLSLQERIVSALEQADGQPFLRDAWERPEGGGGISRLIEEGNVIERGGVNNVNPGPDEELQTNDQVLLLGSVAQLEKARKHLLGDAT